MAPGMSFQRKCWNGTDVVGLDRVAGEHSHAELTGEEAEAQCVVRSADHAIVVEVEAAGNTSVGRRHEGVRVLDRLGAVLADLEVVVPEQVSRQLVRDVVELLSSRTSGACAG